MLPSGNIVCVDQPFFDHLGYTPADITGKPFASFTLDPVELQWCAAGEQASGHAARGTACGGQLLFQPSMPAPHCPRRWDVPPDAAHSAPVALPFFPVAQRHGGGGHRQPQRL